jgi:hypothetical protein
MKCGTAGSIEGVYSKTKDAAHQIRGSTLSSSSSALILHIRTMSFPSPEEEESHLLFPLFA